MLVVFVFVFVVLYEVLVYELAFSGGKLTAKHAMASHVLLGVAMDNEK